MNPNTEIVFFDLETTLPYGDGQCRHLLEFGAIVVCPRTLLELQCYSTLVKPTDLFAVAETSVRCNGITRAAVASAPSFCEVADVVYNILHGRVWAGHNIEKFDCVRMGEAFAKIGRPPPEPKGTIDTWTLLTERFGGRARNMKMATLAAYFGLGQQTHRSLDDVRMNIEVVKYCSTVLFLESTLPNMLPMNSLSPNKRTRSQSNTNTAAEVLHPVDCNMAIPDPFNMAPLLIDQVQAEPKQPDGRMEEASAHGSPDIYANACENEGSSGYAGFLDPEEVSVPSLSASNFPSYWGQTIQLLHKDIILQLSCAKLRVRSGVSKRFRDSYGRPRVSIALDSPPSLCRVLDVCDNLAQTMSVDSGSNSIWWPVVTRDDSSNSATVRLNIPYVGSTSVYATEIDKKHASGRVERLVFNNFNATQLDSLFVPGALVDAFFSLDIYDYQQSTGIRLVAKKLIINS